MEAEYLLTIGTSIQPLSVKPLASIGVTMSSSRKLSHSNSCLSEMQMSFGFPRVIYKVFAGN